jgi:Cu/Ag efflux protein CusF
MKAIVKAVFIAHLALAAVPVVYAQAAQTNAGTPDSVSTGEIKKIDKSAGKLTIKHGPLKNLGMGAMTMIFKAKDPAMLNEVKEGDKINFVAENANGQLTVTKLERGQ